MNPKPGLTTSELYVNLIAAVLSLLVVRGVLGRPEADAWLANGGAAVPAILAVVYTWSRTRVKQKSAELEKLKLVEVIQERARGRGR